jgi:hypothetical protein
LAGAQNSYDITLADFLFVDPTFSKAHKYTEFFPLKFKTIDSSKFMKLSASSRSLLVHMVGLSYTQGGPKIALSVLEVPPYRGVSVESLIRELNDYGYLECPYIKEKIKIKENNIKTTEPQKAVTVAAPKNNQSVSINLLSKEVQISQLLVKSWADTYPQEYLELELKKARSWLISNPHKAPKSNFGRFFNSWFDRGWESYRKTLTSNGTILTAESLEEMLRNQ